jgi:CubicO group peptidase (beta-lactamase class C family)
LARLVLPRVASGFVVNPGSYRGRTQPGTDWQYGPSVDIQGYIVEKLSGQPLDVFLRTKILEPLGMKDTGFWVDGSKADRVSQMFTYDSEKRIISAPEQGGSPTLTPVFLSGGGGLLSTTDDYFRFAQMMLRGGEANGKRFLKATTVLPAQLIDAPRERDTLFVHCGEIHLSVVLHAQLKVDVALPGAYLALAAGNLAIWLRDAPQHAIAVAAGCVGVHQACNERVPRQRLRELFGHHALHYECQLRPPAAAWVQRSRRPGRVTKAGTVSPRRSDPRTCCR